MNLDIYHYNDYELLYLIHQEIDEAREILIWKYSFLIKNRIKQFNVPVVYYDDFYQEGLIMLLKSIDLFDEHSQMKFTSFFDLLLKRRIVNLLKSEQQAYNTIKKENFYDLLDISDTCFEAKGLVDKIQNISKKCSFSQFEEDVFKLHFLKNTSIKEVTKLLNATSKNVSNAKQRIIRKLKHYIYK